MKDLPPLLGLLRLASPALPVGGFSYSEGLEAALEAGIVRDEASALPWLLSSLELVQARSELPALAAAWQAWGAEAGGAPIAPDIEALEQINRWVLSSRETAELRLQAEQMGRSLAEWLRHQPHDVADNRLAVLRALSPAPTWPVAFALAGRHTGAPLEQLLAASAFAWAENAVQAAIKAIPLGQVAGQRLLAHLSMSIPGAVKRALDACHGQAPRQNFCPMLAILSARHETQYSRLFRS